MYGLKMFKIWGEMSEQVSVETSWYHGLTCLRDELSVSLSQSPRESSRSESELVSLKYCFTSAGLLSSFPDFSATSRVFVNVYWFTTYADIFFALFLLLHLSRSALVCDISLVLNCFLSCNIPYHSTMLELW